MKFLYITSDKIGSETGGGAVTFNELEALKSIAPTDVINPPVLDNPFETDKLALEQVRNVVKDYKLAHFYAGTFTQTIKFLRENGVYVTYTCAAHDPDESIAEFGVLGLDYPFKHMSDKALREFYIQGYREADLVMCPSKHSKEILHKQGCKKVVIVPHGHYEPKEIRVIPERFQVAYLGQCGPDKGLIYLIKAWSLLNYSDSQLMIVGRGTEDFLPWVRQHGKGSIHLAGFVKDIGHVYNYCSVYVQPSVSEGFGIEVLEAMSYGRPVICSDGAGAKDCIENNGIIVPRRNPQAIADAIDDYKKNPNKIKKHGEMSSKLAKNYTWKKAIEQYSKIWKEGK